ncbi:hypothetical protein HU200_049913 [Digitaria exilis]|uniref:Histone-binding protein RBBP4-like N-terminal domain-containing protein n=1 Tax=Digitaria exilis TaxID=1010633 RepID=A0A835E822_9POAL|nr:hypothetical protein HU200_049913 [Digitaria exilis]
MPRNIKKARKAKSKKAKVWQPGVDALEDGEELQFDPEAYNYLRGFSIGWSCLSFDVVRDQLGLVRSEFPHTFYGVAGTQAEKAAWNYIGVFKLSNISGKKREPIPASAVDGDTDMDSDSSSDEEDEEINEDTKPILHMKKVAHVGCVNRIRSMNQKPHICATWGDTGHVQVIRMHHVDFFMHSASLTVAWLLNMQVWDLSSFLNSLAESGSATPAPKEDDIIHKHLPVKVFSGHQKEGYAIDWSPLVTGRLVSGVHLIFSISQYYASPFVGHSASVEDLQWSPTEADVFASCSVDGTIAIWDIRKGKKPCISIEAHKDDVNVISWNRLASSMIASGSDDGNFSVHDLRSIKGQRDLKELHWHPQIPSLIISTAVDGFNVLMPSNIGTTIPGDTDAAMASAEP